jgi:hypothetical protein
MKNLKHSLMTLAALALVLTPTLALAHAHPFPVTTGRAHSTTFHDHTPTVHDHTPRRTANQRETDPERPAEPTLAGRFL